MIVNLNYLYGKYSFNIDDNDTSITIIGGIKDTNHWPELRNESLVYPEL